MREGATETTRPMRTEEQRELMQCRSFRPSQTHTMLKLRTLVVRRITAAAPRRATAVAATAACARPQLLACALRIPQCSSRTRAFSTNAAATASSAATTTPAAPSASSADNPLLAPSVLGDLPRYSTLTADHIRSGAPVVISELRTSFRSLESTLSTALSAGKALSWSDLVVPLESLLDRFSYVFGLVGHLAGVRDSPELRAAIAETEPARMELSLEFAQSKIVFQALRSLAANPASPLSTAQQKILADLILEAELSGVGLDDAARAEFNALSQRVSRLSQVFGHNVLDAMKRFGLTITEREVVKGLPASARALYAEHARTSSPQIASATAENGPWRVSLAGPHVVPFLTYSPSRPHRQLVHEAYISRASQADGFDNAPVIAEILLLKRRIANLLGYATHAHVSLATKLVRHPSRVDSFLEELRAVALPLAQKDLEELRAFATKQGFPAHQSLAAYDTAFYSQKLMNSRFQLDPEQLRPYFPFPRVLQGLFQLMEKLFDVRIVERDASQVGPGKTVDTWHKDVKYCDVFRRNEEGGEKIIAGFYIDAYSRPENKRGGAWMGEAIGRAIVQTPDGRAHTRLPVAYLVCNQPAGVDGRPSLMSFDEVSTLFHELGHVSQHLLTTVDHSLAAGIRNVAWDAVELPSQFLEEFAYDRATIMSLSSHVETGAPLPQELYAALIASRNFRAASALLRQVHFSMIDMALHDAGVPALSQATASKESSAVTVTPAAGGNEAASVSVSPSALARITDDIRVLERRVSDMASVLPFNPSSRFLHSFSHIFAGGYAAGYFSYKWAEVMSADAFEVFVEARRSDVPLSAEEADRRWRVLGLQFRDSVLAKGGSMDAAEVFRLFRGRDPTVTALLKQSGLISEAEAAAKANAIQ